MGRDTEIAIVLWTDEVLTVVEAEGLKPKLIPKTTITTIACVEFSLKPNGKQLVEAEGDDV